MQKISLDIKDDISPICPYCGAEVNNLYAKKVECPELSAKLTKYYRYLYFCQNCKKALGITHFKAIGLFET
jgi:uncharacterized protein with PIN domain